MIKVILYKRNNEFVGFEISGHAMYSYGEYDIVCAGVSALSQSYIFHLVNDYELEDEVNFVVKQDSGYLKLELIKNNRDIQNSFKFLVTGLKLLESEYNKHVKVLEVQYD